MNFTFQGRLTVWDVPIIRALSGQGRFMETFRIKAVPGDGTCTLVLTGEADLATAEDIVELGNLSLSDAAVHTLIIDLAAVTFIDSTAIGTLIQLRNAAEDSDRKLILTNLPDRVLRVLTVAGLDMVFAID